MGMQQAADACKTFFIFTIDKSLIVTCFLLVGKVENTYSFTINMQREHERSNAVHVLT